MNISRFIFLSIAKCKMVILLFWISIAVFGGVYCIDYMTNHTSSTFDAPKGTPSFDSMVAFSEEFPVLANQSTIICLLYSNAKGSILDYPGTSNFSSAIEQWFWKQDVANSFMSYYSFFRKGMTSLAKPLLSHDLRTTLIVMNINGSDLHLVNVFTDTLYLSKQQFQEEHLPSSSGIEVFLTGFPVEVRDSRNEGKSLMSKIDMIILPIALVILMGFVRSWRLIIVPCVTIGVSILATYAAGAGIIALHAKVPDFSVTLATSAVIAMSVDYSLFLLTRYRLEVRRGFDSEQATETMLATAGKNVLFSGIIVSICFSGTVLLPVNLLSGLGLIAGSAVMVTILVNLTLAPALMLTFPSFFKHFVEFKLSFNIGKMRSVFGYKRIETERVENVESGKIKDYQHDYGSINGEDEDKRKRKAKVEKSLWYKIGVISTDYPWLVMLAIILVMLPFGIQLIWMHDEISFLNMVPHEADSVKGLLHLQNEFSLGTIAPYMLMISGDQSRNPNFTVCSESFFTLVNDVLIDLTRNVDNLTMSDIQSLVYVESMGAIHWSFANVLLNRIDAPIYYMDEGLSYRWGWFQSVNPSNTSMIIRITLKQDPFADSSRLYLNEIRDTISNLETKYSKDYIRFSLLGEAPVMFDLADLVFSLLPFMAGVTVGVCVIIAAIAFRSAFLPLRVGATCLLSVLWSYGIAVGIFQEGWLNWLVPAYGNSSGLYWVTPITSLCLILGLGLDYEIFLLISVIEIRKYGYTDKDSIVKGVYRTGGVISAAGLIMTLAFGSLLMSSSMVNNQYALLICFAVLLDAFVVRVWFIPAIMKVMGPLNWWPMKMPDPCKSADSLYDLHD